MIRVITDATEEFPATNRQYANPYDAVIFLLRRCLATDIGRLKLIDAHTIQKELACVPVQKPLTEKGE
jgi:hypothetical protein